MKTRAFTTIRFGLFCLSLLIALGLARCSLGQNVQAMVKSQPFPYPTGVAMDVELYGLVKAKLQAADSLRTSSEAAIKSLLAQILATRKAMDDQFRLGQYDQAKAQTLLVQMNILQQQLTVAQQDLLRAEKAIERVLKELPRKQRKLLQEATPDQIAQATVDYVHTLQSRKWKWAGAAGGVGFVLGLLTALF